MRGKDSVTTYLNQRYPRLVSACSGVLGGGMLPRVSSSTAADDRDRSSVHRNRYPCFALQVTCDPSEYDVVLEPDRSYAVFKDEASLMRCMEEMLLAMIEEHVPMERKADLVRAVREASTIAPPHGGLHRGVHSMITASHDDASHDRVVCNLFHDYSCQSNDNDYDYDYTYEQCISTPAPMSAPKRPFAVGNLSPSPSSRGTIHAPRPLSVRPTIANDYMQQSTGQRSSGDRLFADAFFDSSTINNSFFQLLRFSPNFRSISTSEQDDACQSHQRPSTDSDRSVHLCRHRPSHCFDDSPYSPYYRVRAPSRSTGPQGMREVLDETSVSSLGDMIIAVADKHAKPQLELINRKRKAVEHDDDDDDGDGRASKQLRSEPPRGIHHIQSEYAVYVRRVPLLIDIALQEEDPPIFVGGLKEEDPPICVGGQADPSDSPSPRASASELYGDDEYFDTQVNEDDDDDVGGSGYERSDRMDGDDVHPCDRPSDSCYPVDDDPFQHSVTVFPSTDIKLFLTMLRVPPDA